MSETVLAGVSAAPGTAAGPIRRLATQCETQGPVAPAAREAEVGDAASALDQAALELETLSARLQAEGRASEAEIVETGVLMAADPGLRREVESAIREQGDPASRALLEAAEHHAATIAALDDPLLAARAEDVRSLGRRAARIASGRPDRNQTPAFAEVICVADDLGPADVAELAAEVRAVALARGGATAHAAIVARSLGLPMVVGLGEDLMRAAGGSVAVLDGGAGTLVLEPTAARLEAAEQDTRQRLRAREQASAARSLAAVTRDGRRISVLTNAAGRAEVEAGLAAGAEGVGLLRTELSFLKARDWPTEEEHLRALSPALELLPGLPATVRVLDFGGDKTPPFLAGTSRRGLELLLAHPDALAAQLRAVLAAGAPTRLRILLPMVHSAADVDAVRDILRAELAASPAIARPQLGAMIELAEAAEHATEIAATCDFLSVGSNDLTHSVLGGDRFAPGDSAAHHPEVMRSIARVASAAKAARIPLEVCGEAASDPRTAPLLIGIGADELSVGAARVGSVRAWVRSLDFERTEAMARSVLRARTIGEVAGLVGPGARRLELLDEPADPCDERRDGRVGVVSVSPKA